LPAGVDFAIEFTTFCLNPDKYLAYLKNRVELGGGRFVSYELPTTGGFSKALSSAAGKIGKAPDIWVNASGLGARLLVGDDNLYPTRGQTVLVKGNPNGATTRLGVDYITYIIPRPGGTVILGGCKQDENWNQDVDKELSAAIQNRCKKFAPELLNKDGEFDIISEQVGFRPSRRGGPRVEAELVEGNSKEKPYLVVHCYGNSGSGYQSSIGCTRKAVRLVEEYINENLRSR
jgi:glycine/D-amino acid oxidase-like deaminating enzyme